MLQLQKATSELAKTLAEVLESRIKERRGLHSAVLQYLHSNLSTSTATDVFTVPTHEAIRKFIRRLVTRLETTAADDSEYQYDVGNFSSVRRRPCNGRQPVLRISSNDS